MPVAPAATRRCSGLMQTRAAACSAQMRRGEAAERRLHAPAAAGAAQFVDVAEELRGERRCRMRVQVFRGTTLEQTPAPQQRDAIAHADRFVRIVGDDDRGRARVAKEADCVLPHSIAKPVVQARERLVHQQHLRIRGERARERDALAFAARQHVRIAIGVKRETDAIEQRANGAIGLRAAPVPEAERHVRRNSQVGKQRVVLEDHANAPLLRFDAHAGGPRPRHPRW